MTSDRKFLEAVAAVRRAPFGKRVIHFFSSWARSEPDYGQKLDKAMSVITRSVMTHPDAGCFVLSSGDIVFICAQVSASVLGSLCSRLESEFFGNAEPRRNMYGELKYYKVFDAGKELSALVVGVKSMLASETVTDQRPPIGVREYERIVGIVRNNDFRTAVFNQPVYMATEKASIEYIEFYVSLEQLCKIACPDHSIAGNPWLFNMIKGELDRQVMRVVAREIGEYRHKAFAVNLMGETFLSKDFETFVTSLPARLTGKLYVEIDRGDFLHHSGDLDKILRRSQEFNVPVCVDGVTLNDLRVFRLPCGLEFVKVKWSDDISAMPKAELEGAVRALKECGLSKIVLSRCDSERSLVFANALGIPFVQGRLADRMFRSGIRFTEADA